MSPSTDSFDDILQLVEFSLCEAQALRSFLEYLRKGDDPPEKKLARVQQWPLEIGLEIAKSKQTEKWTKLFQTLRDQPPEQRRVAVRQILAEADALYLFPNSR